MKRAVVHLIEYSDGDELDRIGMRGEGITTATETLERAGFQAGDVVAIVEEDSIVIGSDVASMAIQALKVLSTADVLAGGPGESLGWAAQQIEKAMGI